jgi:hypothetical protein
MSDPYAPSVPLAAFPVADLAHVADDADAPAGDGYDRERVLRLLDQLERDVTAVEAAMVHAEAGDHDAFAAAVAPLEPHLAD